MRKLRETLPFIMLGITQVIAILSSFDYYPQWYKYLPDLFGYSLTTNLFMLAVYFNGRYCLSVKVAVVALMALNILNLFSHSFNFYSQVYDFYITLLASTVVLILILNKK